MIASGGESAAWQTFEAVDPSGEQPACAKGSPMSSETSEISQVRLHVLLALGAEA